MRHPTGTPPLLCRPGTGCSARLSLCLQVVEKGGPYPLIVLPQFGGYWIEDPENVSTPTSLGSSICEDEEEDSLHELCLHESIVRLRQRHLSRNKV